MQSQFGFPTIAKNDEFEGFEFKSSTLIDIFIGLLKPKNNPFRDT